MPRLSVNINKIATLRNTRRSGTPSIVRLAAQALDAGAHGITVHPRPDQRHIRPADVDALAELLKSYPAAEYCIEGNPFHGLIEHCLRARPAQALLVPDEHTALTSNHGWEVMPVVRQLGAERVELYTEPYAAAAASGQAAQVLERYARATHAARDLELGVNAGHDLNLQNLGPFLKGTGRLDEVSIGHALIADALELGIAEATRRYLAVCQG